MNIKHNNITNQIALGRKRVLFGVINSIRNSMTKKAPNQIEFGAKSIGKG